MIEERGWVTAVEPGAVWVETLRRTSCSDCSMKASCGQGILAHLGRSKRSHVRALASLPLQPGDEVVLGIGEGLLVKTAMLFYLAPLLGLLGLALLAARIGLSEFFVIAAGLAGFGLTWLWVRRWMRRHANDPECQPVVLRAC